MAEKEIQLLIPKQYNVPFLSGSYPSTNAGTTDFNNIFNGADDKAYFALTASTDGFYIYAYFTESIASRYVGIRGFASTYNNTLTGSWYFYTQSMTHNTTSSFYELQNPYSGSFYAFSWAPVSGTNATTTYEIKNFIVSDNFTVPMYNSDYTIEYSFGEEIRGVNNFVGTAYPDYTVRSMIKRIARYTYNWTVLTEAEKDVFLRFYDALNNSSQPFLFIEKMDSSATVVKEKLVILDGKLNITKDKNDYYSVTLTLLQIGED